MARPRVTPGKCPGRRRVVPPDNSPEVTVLLILALVLLVVFGGLGFAAHVLWLGLIVGLILAVAHVIMRGAGRT